MLSVDGLEQLIEPVLNQMGLGLHFIELKHEGKDLVLRIVTDRAEKRSPEDGVSLEELERANREVGAMLDLEDPIEGRYRLTIESPGIERDLSTWRQIGYAIGERVHVVTRGDDATVYEGTLVRVEDEPKRLVLRVDAAEQTIDYLQVKSAKTVFVWPKSGKTTPIKR